MIGSALRSGTLDKSKIIIEASSGNTGIAIASIARDLGYRAKIYVPPVPIDTTTWVNPSGTAWTASGPVV